jgi:hypothetical protein
MTPRLLASMVSFPTVSEGSALPRRIVAGVPEGKTAKSKVMKSAGALVLALVRAPRREQSAAAPVQAVRPASEVVSTI